MTELATKSTMLPSGTFEPQDFAGLVIFAERLAKSSMVPKDFVGKPDNIIAAVIAGREVGLSAWAALQSYAIINGKATMWGDAVLALVRSNSHVCEYVRERLASADEVAHYVEAMRAAAEMDDQTIADKAARGFWSLPSVSISDSTVAVCEAKRRDSERPTLILFSVGDARTAKLWEKKGREGEPTPWITYPQRMLQMRARSWALRDAFPDVLRGTAIREEVEDYEEPQNVTPVTAAPGATRGEQVRNTLQNLASKVDEAQAGTTDEGELERPLPNVAMMLSPEIGEVVRAEAEAVEMPDDVAREIIGRLAKNRLSRSNALAVITEIRRWKKPPDDDGLAGVPVPAAPKPPEPPLECMRHNCPVSECASAECTRTAMERHLQESGQPTLLPST